MTMNKLTRTMKANGYTADKYTCFSPEYLTTVTYTEYEKNGKVALEVVKVRDEAKVTFIHVEYAKEMADMGLTVGTIIY